MPRDAAALAALVPQAKVVISTVGPYQLHGEPLLQACVDAGTDYVDLCGEPLWMARMIDLHEAAARASGARIVFSCGFDSIPFDLGVVFLQAEAQRRFGRPLQRVRGRVRVMKGGFSGGTMASALATVEAIGRDRSLARVLADPFALTPGFRGPAQPEGDAAAYDDAAEAWTGPFVMAAINTKNVHRSNALRGHPWGSDFVYDERMLARERRPRQGAGAHRAGCRPRRSASARRANCCAASCCPSRARGRASASATAAATKCCSSATPRRASGCAPWCAATATPATARPASSSAKARCAWRRTPARPCAAAASGRRARRWAWRWCGGCRRAPA